MDDMLNRPQQRGRQQDSTALFEAYSAYHTFIGKFMGDCQIFENQSRYDPSRTYRVAFFTLLLSDARRDYNGAYRYENTLAVRCKVTNSRLIDIMVGFEPKSTRLLVHGRLVSQYQADSENGNEREGGEEKNEQTNEKKFPRKEVVFSVKDIGFSLLNNYIYDEAV